MTVIRPNSIAGINSITAQGNSISIFKSDGSSGLELTGATINSSTGISTFNTLSVSNGAVISGVSTISSLSVTGTTTVGLGTTGSPSISPTGDSNTGVFFPSADTIAFAEGGIEAARFDSSGRLLVGVSTAISNGGVLQVSNGITFPATQSACSDANTLDDYEEGSWTPALRGVGTAGTYQLASSTGKYTKIGNVVVLSFVIVLASSVTGGGTGYLQITGAPFTNANVSEGVICLERVAFGAASSTFVSLEFITSSGTNILYLRESGNNTTGTDLPVSSIIANSVLKGTISFQAQ